MKNSAFPKKLWLLVVLLSPTFTFSQAFGEVEPGYRFRLHFDTEIQQPHGRGPLRIRFFGFFQGVPLTDEVSDNLESFLDGDYLFDVRLLKRNHYPERNIFSNNSTLDREEQYTEYRHANAFPVPPDREDFPLLLEFELSPGDLDPEMELIFQINLHQLQFFGMASKWIFRSDRHCTIFQDLEGAWPLGQIIHH